MRKEIWIIGLILSTFFLPIYGQNVTVDIKNQTLDQVITDIADSGQIAISVDPKLRDIKVNSLALNHVPIDALLRILCREYNCRLQKEADKSLRIIRVTPVDIDLKGVDLRLVLEKLVALSGKKISLPQSLEGKVFANIRNVLLQEAIQAILADKGLAKTKLTNTWKIPSFAQKHTEILPNQKISLAAKSKSLAEIIENIKEKTQVNIYYDEYCREIMVNGDYDRVHWLRVLQSICRNKRVRVIEVEKNIWKVEYVPTVTMELQGADIRDCLTWINAVANTNIIIPSDSYGSISCRLKDVFWDEALNAMVAVSGRKIIRETQGNIMRLERGVEPEIFQNPIGLSTLNQKITKKHLPNNLEKLNSLVSLIIASALHRDINIVISGKVVNGAINKTLKKFTLREIVKNKAEWKYYSGIWCLVTPDSKPEKRKRKPKELSIKILGPKKVSLRESPSYKIIVYYSGTEAIKKILLRVKVPKKQDYFLLSQEPQGLKKQKYLYWKIKLRRGGKKTIRLKFIAIKSGKVEIKTSVYVHRKKVAEKKVKVMLTDLAEEEEKKQVLIKRLRARIEQLHKIKKELQRNPDDAYLRRNKREQIQDIFAEYHSRLKPEAIKSGIQKQFSDLGKILIKLHNEIVDSLDLAERVNRIFIDGIIHFPETPGRSIAFFNNKIFTVGQTIQGLKIKKIEIDNVVLEHNNMIFHCWLSSKRRFMLHKEK